MEIVDNKALLITVRRPERFTDAIKSSAYLGEVSEGVHEIMVKWDFDNSEALTKLGLKKVPSVIHRDYKWSGRFIPMDHQKETAGFIINNPRCFVFNEQGVGKTASAAWAVDYLMNIGKVKRVLVVCPLSIMRPAWQRDLFQVLPHRSVGIAHGTPKSRRTVIQGKYEFVILNFDGIEIVLQELKDAKFDCIIVDEANALKSTQTRRWKAFKQLLTPEMRLVLMTGTPAAQSPEDAYGLAKLVSPLNVPPFASGWKDLVMQKISTFKWIPRPRAKDIVFKALQPAIRFTKEECLDLPDITYETREVPLTPQQEKYYQVLRKQLLIEAAGESVSAVNAAAKLNKL
jgi:SNF2 family DNA or RNA helicase